MAILYFFIHLLRPYILSFLVVLKIEHAPLNHNMMNPIKIGCYSKSLIAETIHVPSGAPSNSTVLSSSIANPQLCFVFFSTLGLTVQRLTDFLRALLLEPGTIMQNLLLNSIDNATCCEQIM